MNNTTVYVGMDVHKESFTLCAYTIEAERGSHFQRTEANYKNVLQYLEFLRTIYGNDVNFICGYEAGCLGYTLYHQLTANNVNCVILAPTTMLEQRSRRRIKTDKRDAEIIGKCLAQHNYSPVHIPTATDEETKEFLRMRDDHKLALKKVKQQILAFCLRHNYRYDGNSHWTAAHIKWLKSLNPEEALPQSKGIRIIHAVVGALQSNLAAARICGRIRHGSFPQEYVGAKADIPVDAVVLLIQGGSVIIVIASHGRCLETELVGGIPIETEHLVDMIVSYGILVR